MLLYHNNTMLGAGGEAAKMVISPLTNVLPPSQLFTDLLVDKTVDNLSEGIKDLNSNKE